MRRLYKYGKDGQLMDGGGASHVDTEGTSPPGSRRQSVENGGDVVGGKEYVSFETVIDLETLNDKRAFTDVHLAADEIIDRISESKIEIVNHRKLLVVSINKYNTLVDNDNQFVGKWVHSMDLPVLENNVILRKYYREQIENKIKLISLLEIEFTGFQRSQESQLAKYNIVL